MWGKLRKPAFVFMAGVMMAESALSSVAFADTESVSVEEIMAETEAAPETEGAANSGSENLMEKYNWDFEGADKGVPYWWYESGKCEQALGSGLDNTNCMIVKAEQYPGMQLFGGDRLALNAGDTYEYSYYAKAVKEVEGGIGLQVTILCPNWGNPTPATLTTDGDYDFSNDKWTKVSGTFTIPNAENMGEGHLQFACKSDYYVDNLVITKKEAPSENLFDNGDFSVSGNWYPYSSGASLEFGKNSEEDVATLGEGYAKITGRTQNWECIGQDMEKKVKNGSKYHFSFYAKLSEEYADEERTIQFCTTKKDKTDKDELYDKLPVTGGSSKVTSKEWTKIEGTVTVTWKEELEKLVFKFSEQGDPLSEGQYGSYYIANAQLVEVKETNSIEKDLTGLYTVIGSATGLGDGVKTGTCLPGSALSDDVRMELAAKHFNSVTTENEMKPDALLGETPNIGEDGYPILNFKQGDEIADAILEYNKANGTDIKMRGHVLVWHSQTPEWFFHEDYNVNEPLVKKEDMLKRMDNYIEQVLTHYNGPDSKYKDLIYAWDVVNEAIDDATNKPRSSSSKAWYQIFPQDDSFIRHAYVTANQFAPDNVKLFYNDYNDTTPGKVAGICELLKAIKSTEGARIDGMGMQGHYSMGSPSTTELENAIRAYSAIVDEVQITELDLKASNDYTGVDKQKEYTKQAYRYKELYNTLCKLNKELGNKISALVFWGTDDGHSWLNDANSAGGGSDGSAQCPLLFDANYKAKPAYWAFVDSTNLEPFINQATALNVSDAKDALAYSFKAGDSDAKVFPAWDDKNLTITVQVPDITNKDTDAVTLYVDAANARKDGAGVEKYTLKRSEGKAIQNGYEVTFKVPVSDLKISKKIGVDIVVTNDTTSYSWNDLTNKQDTTSKYYAELLLKPFMSVAKGKATIDGKADAIWDKVAPVKLAIKGGAPEADATAKLLWDEDNLYVYMQVKDSVLDDTNSAAHEKDSVEIFIDETNGKTDSLDEDDKQYRINYKNEITVNGSSCKAEYINSKVQLNDAKDGYILEAAIKWSALKPSIGQLIGLDLQLNDAKDGGRIGTLNWYDESGSGWSKSAVFGTVKLADAVITTDPKPGKPEDSQNNKPTKPTKPVEEEPVVENKQELPAGAIIDTDTANYSVLDATAKTVEYKGPVNKKASKVSIPSVITVDGVEYKVTKISASAFKNNKKLTTVTISENITEIGSKAFYGCKKLKKVTIKSTVLKKVGSKAFYRIKSNATIKVPKKQLKAYKKLLKKKAPSTVKIKK